MKRVFANKFFDRVKGNLKVRASVLWIPGILFITIGILIQARVTWLFRYNAYVAKHAIACRLDVDLNKKGIKEMAFVPLFTRKFDFGFHLHTPIPDNADLREPDRDILSSNPIEKAMKAETFEVSWQLQKEGQNVTSGTISEKDLNHRVQALDIQYIFAKRNVLLRKGQNYMLVAEVTKPSQALAAFSPELLIRTWASLKGHLLVGWKMRDTMLCLALGFVLIAAGLLRQYSEGTRK